MLKVAGLAALANQRAVRVDAPLFAFLTPLTSSRWHRCCRNWPGGLPFGPLHRGQREKAAEKKRATQATQFKKKPLGTKTALCSMFCVASKELQIKNN